MVRIPNIKIPSVRVGSIVPTSNIGTGGATPAPPTPITYLTQWKIVGNSEVHTLPYLTSWKVEGNSVVDNNAILSCGDLGQDGKYHVKIFNGVTIYDIPLTEPLRKVNDVADTIEFPSEAEGKALVTRNLGGDKLGNFTWNASDTANSSSIKRWDTKALKGVISASSVILTIEYTKGNTWNRIDKTYSYDSNDFFIYDKDYNTEDSYNDFIAHINNYDIIYELATPTTELVDAPQIAVSPIYTSANETPYSAFEHTKHSEIWSCGEYNATDGKYHILVKPEGGSIADIALDEPLRKVNDVADTIEFPSDTEGKALVTRKIASVLIKDCSFIKNVTNTTGKYRYKITNMSFIFAPTTNPNDKANVLCNAYSTISANNTYRCYEGVSVSGSSVLFFDSDYNTDTDIDAFKAANVNTELIGELATPTTELVDAPQIEEAESYTCEISQGAKAVEWSSFTTDSE